MKRRNIIIICSAAFIILLSAVLSIVAVYNNGKNSGFIHNTYINGIDVSDMPVDEAEKKLVEKWNGKEYIVKDKKNGKRISTLTDFDFKYDITDELGKAQQRTGIVTVLAYYGIAKNDISVAMKTDGYGGSFIKQIKEIDLPVSGSKKVETRNAYVDMSDTEFRIVPEVYGNVISRKSLAERIRKDITDGVFLMEYDEEEFYVQPEVKKDDPELLAKQENCRKFLTMDVSIDLKYRTMKLTPEQLAQMIDVDDTSSTVSKKKVQEFVDDNATAAEYKYISYSGKGGYALDRKSLIHDLYKLLRSGEDGKCTAKYTDGRVSPGTTDTYVEVDISRQHLWFMYKGKLLVETDIVTGNVAKNDDTPTGLYSVYAMLSPTTLNGFNDDGTKYASDVSFWMPFNGGVGLHDAPWKSVYGGSEYLTRGSHGCVNMPYNAAKTTYEHMTVGTAVLVHP